jgi:hypothetical protein
MGIDGRIALNGVVGECDVRSGLMQCGIKTDLKATAIKVTSEVTCPNDTDYEALLEKRC